MPGATPLYALPYPIGTDRLDAAVTTIPQSLAQAVESTIAAFGGIAAPGSWTTLTPAVGVNAGGAIRNLGYRKIGNVVWVRGRVNLAAGIVAGNTLYTFPVGFRPTGTLTVTLPGNTPSMVRADVTSAGAVIIQDTVTAGGFIGLDQLRFTVD